MFKRRPYMRYSAALSCVGLALIAESIFLSGYAIGLVVVGLTFMLLALLAVLYHELARPFGGAEFYAACRPAPTS
jgi:hypothetical protein